MPYSTNCLKAGDLMEYANIVQKLSSKHQELKKGCLRDYALSGKMVVIWGRVFFDKISGDIDYSAKIAGQKKVIQDSSAYNDAVFCYLRTIPKNEIINGITFGVSLSSRTKKVIAAIYEAWD